MVGNRAYFEEYQRSVRRTAGGDGRHLDSAGPESGLGTAGEELHAERPSLGCVWHAARDSWIMRDCMGLCEAQEALKPGAQWFAQEGGRPALMLP